MGVGPILGGRYELREVLGEGGNGTVFRAIHFPVGRDVAVKVLRPGASPNEWARFVREIALVQRLEHPNTVRLFDFGVTPGGQPYTVFELLRGRTLEAELARGPMDPARVTRIATQILKSLMEAHQHGIIHRDVKPANVVLCDHPGEPDFVKLLDFGVARPTTGPVITARGQIVGTPTYMAPEQAYGGHVTTRADLYALGLVMAEALAGEPVYVGTPSTVCVAQASGEPVPLPAVVRSSALGPVIEKATQKDAAMRFASAEEMLAAIEQPRVTTPPAPPVVYTPPPLPSRRDDAYRPRHVAAIATALLLVLTLVFVRAKHVSFVRTAAAAAPLVVMNTERAGSLGLHADKVRDESGADGTRYEAWVLRAGDGLPQAYVYLTTFKDEKAARSDAVFQRAGNPTTVVKQEGVQVVRTLATDRATAERVMALFFP